MIGAQSRYFLTLHPLFDLLQPYIQVSFQQFSRPDFVRGYKSPT